MNTVTLTADLHINPNGFRVFIGEQILYIHETSALHRELEEMRVERDFWRRATELALRAMSDAEDRLEDAVRVVRDYVGGVGRVTELEALAKSLNDAPPENVG